MMRSEAYTCGIVDETYDDIAELELLVLEKLCDECEWYMVGVEG